MVDVVIPCCSPVLIKRFEQHFMVKKGWESYLVVEPKTVRKRLQQQLLHNLCRLVDNKKSFYSFHKQVISNGF